MKFFKAKILFFYAVTVVAFAETSHGPEEKQRETVQGPTPLSSPYISMQFPRGQQASACQGTFAFKKQLKTGECQYGIITAAHCLGDSVAGSPKTLPNFSFTTRVQDEKGAWRDGELVGTKPGKKIDVVVGTNFGNNVLHFNNGTQLDRGDGIDAAWIFFPASCSLVPEETVATLDPRVPSLNSELKLRRDNDIVRRGLTPFGRIKGLFGRFDETNRKVGIIKIENTEPALIVGGNSGGAITRQIGGKEAVVGIISSISGAGPLLSGTRAFVQDVHYHTNGIGWAVQAANVHTTALERAGVLGEPKLEATVPRPTHTPEKPSLKLPAPGRELAQELAEEPLQITKGEKGLVLKQGVREVPIFFHKQTHKPYVKVDGKYVPVSDSVQKALEKYYESHAVKDASQSALVESFKSSQKPAVPPLPEVRPQRPDLRSSASTSLSPNPEHYAGKCLSCHGNGQMSPHFANREEALKALSGLKPGQLDHMLKLEGNPLKKHFDEREINNLRAFVNRSTARANLAPPANARTQLVSDSDHKTYSKVLPKGCSNDSGGEFLENLKTRGMVFYNDRVSPKGYQAQLIQSPASLGPSPNSIGITLLDPKQRTPRDTGFGDGSKYADEGNSGFPWKDSAGVLRKEESDRSFKFFVPPPNGPLAKISKVETSDRKYFSRNKNDVQPVYGAEYQIGTVLSEVITVSDPATGETIPSIIRTMEMTREGWRYDVLSAFDNSADMLDQVKKIASTEKWKNNEQVKAYIAAASDPRNIRVENFLNKLSRLERVQNSHTSKVMQNEALVQHLPELPKEFVSDTIAQGCFRSVMGKPWIEKTINGKQMVGWDPVVDGNFGFYKKGFQGAHVARTTQSCIGCHSTSLTHVRNYDPPIGTLDGSGGPDVGGVPTYGGVRDWYDNIRGSKGQKVAGFPGVEAGAFSLQLFDFQGMKGVPIQTFGAKPIQPNPALFRAGLIEWR